MAALVGVGYAALAREHLVRNMIPASIVLGGPADAAARAPIQALGEAALGGDLRLWGLPGDEYLLRLNVDLSLQSPSVNVLDWTLTSDGCRDWSTTSEIVFRDQLAVPPEGRTTASLIAPRTQSGGLPSSAQFFGPAGGTRGERIGCVDLPFGTGPIIAIDPLARTPIVSVAESSIGGSAESWAGPNGERLVTAHVRVARLEDLPARADGSHLLVWHLTRGACADWSAAAAVVTKDALGVPTSGIADFTVLIPPTIAPDAVLSLQMLHDLPNSIGRRLGCAEVQV